MTGRALWAAGMVLALLGMARADVPPPTPFTTLLRAHWQKWAGESGSITPERLVHLMKERKIKGEDAAVLAAMKRREKDPTTKQPVTWTMKLVEDYEAEAAKPHGKKRYDKAYKGCLTRIQADPHMLFAEGAPHLNSIHQGGTFDCWLLSAIGAIINRNPDEIHKLITDDGENRYSVHFAYHTLTVKAPTDAEIGAYTSNKGDGDWLYVLENAEGQYREDFEHMHHVAMANDNAIAGGSGALAMHDILGHNCDTVTMTPAKPQNTLVRETLTRAFKKRRVIIIGTPDDKTATLPKGIAHGHAMAVIGWDAAADQVTIWNPWDDNIKVDDTDEESEDSKPAPKAPSKPEPAYQTVHGIFTMPLKEFTHVFFHLGVENDQPFKPKVAKAK